MPQTDAFVIPKTRQTQHVESMEFPLTILEKSAFLRWILTWIYFCYPTSVVWYSAVVLSLPPLAHSWNNSNPMVALRRHPLCPPLPNSPPAGCSWSCWPDTNSIVTVRVDRRVDVWRQLLVWFRRGQPPLKGLPWRAHSRLLMPSNLRNWHHDVDAADGDCCCCCGGWRMMGWELEGFHCHCGCLKSQSLCCGDSETTKLNILFTNRNLNELEDKHFNFWFGFSLEMQ